MSMIKKLQLSGLSAPHIPIPRRLIWPLSARQARSSRPTGLVQASPKEIWLQTSDKATFTTAVESGGVSAFVFGPDPRDQARAEAWSTLARFRAVHLDGQGLLLESSTGVPVGEVVAVDGPEAARALEARVQRQRLGRPAAAPPGGGGDGPAGVPVPNGSWALVLDARDWKVIPAENLVALAQAPPGDPASGAAGQPASAVRLLAAAGSAEEARLMLEALQAGTAGVLLRTDDPGQIRSLVSYVSRRATEESSRADARLRYEVARVRAVRQLGMGDRACVDLAGLLQPGEGLLVGSFARCLALVHSECGESEYIAARPFRVNAGPVHAYVSMPGGRTRYLSELHSGVEVQVADPAGRTRTALVGRVKIERRPLVLVELETGGEGSRHSLMLQNAETVKLVGPVGEGGGARGAPSGDVAAAAASALKELQPATRGQQQQQQQQQQGVSGGHGRADACPGGGSGSGRSAGGGGSSNTTAAPACGQQQAQQQHQPEVSTSGSPCGDRGGGGAPEEAAWRAISVSALQPGDLVYVLLQPPARHTGITVEEFIVEK